MQSSAPFVLLSLPPVFKCSEVLVSVSAAESSPGQRTAQTRESPLGEALVSTATSALGGVGPSVLLGRRPQSLCLP